MENYYDHETGHWVTNHSRYEEVASRPEYESLDDLCWDAPTEAWEMLMRLLAAVPEDTVPSAGGILETLVRRHAAVIVPLIEAEAPRNARLQTAGLEMWLLRGDLSPELAERLAAALGPRFWFTDDVK